MMVYNSAVWSADETVGRSGEWAWSWDEQKVLLVVAWMAFPQAVWTVVGKAISMEFWLVEQMVATTVVLEVAALAFLSVFLLAAMSAVEKVGSLDGWASG